MHARAVGRLSTVPCNYITATEMIDGVRHTVVLAPDDAGNYREAKLIPQENGGLTPNAPWPPNRATAGTVSADPSIYLG